MATKLAQLLNAEQLPGEHYRAFWAHRMDRITRQRETN